jgi:hypothetical protein
MAEMGHSATGRGKLQIQQRPQCPVSDGRPEKGGLSLRANCGREQMQQMQVHNADLLDYFAGTGE